ncbi:hypothetical protein V8F06_005084, partial [Rhypophila decipiens]
TYPNPPLNIIVQDGADLQNTRNSKYVDVNMEHVTAWEDFNYDNIKAAYGDLLDRAIDYDDDPKSKPSQIHYPPSQREIVNEPSVDGLMNFWCGRVIRSNMKSLSALARQRLGLSKAEPSLRYKIRQVDEYGPDWSVAVNPKGTIFVMGESKVSAKWKSEWLVAPKRPGGTAGASDERIWPLREVATYCQHGGTRYGFIFTARELVVLRVFFVSQGSGNNKKAGMEWRSVPWNASGSQLTVNLALWALIMMAVNDGYRHLSFKDETYFPLNAWHRLRWSNAQLVHPLSGLQMEEKTLRKHLGHRLVILNAHQEMPGDPSPQPSIGLAHKRPQGNAEDVTEGKRRRK